MDRFTDIKKGDIVEIHVMVRGKCIDRGHQHSVLEDDKGRYVIRKGFRLNINDVAEKNRIVKVNSI